ncbi:MAG: heavy metal-binding domain-containing protein [Aquificota bacterium]
MEIYTFLPPHLEGKIEVGPMLFASAVMAANVVKDIRENIRNLVGGPMGHYENLIEEAIERATKKLMEKAQKEDYDGIVGFRIVHPSLVEGGAEVVVFGNAFKLKKE